MRTVLILLIFSSRFFAQTIDKLDEKNGFKDFKLGDNFSKWQYEVEYEGTWEDGTKGYVYKGNCCNKLFDYPIENITLKFADNKLVTIMISTKKFQREYKESGEYTKWRSNDFENINSSFSYLFGKQTTIVVEKDTYVWSGNKVMLLSRYEYLGIKEGDRQKILIIDKSYLNKNIDDGF
jgi:hypothetical protein